MSSVDLHFFFVINISKKNIKLTQRCKKKIKEKKKLIFIFINLKKITYI